MRPNPSNEILRGGEFLQRAAKIEDECEKFSDAQVQSEMGVKAPECLEKLGTILAEADAIGSCLWSCPAEGFDAHTIQYVVGRASGFGLAIMRLSRFGFYDEALSLVRSLGEIANLLMLFRLDSAAMADWKSSDSSVRRSRFRPTQVRDRILKLKGFVPMDSPKYHRLCELSTHPVPELRPQLFNPHGILSLGATFQQAGVLVVLNETAYLEALIVLLGAKLCNIPKDRYPMIRDDCIGCSRSIGKVNLLDLPTMWEQLQKLSEPSKGVDS
jgi:hypothetical protein